MKITLKDGFVKEYGESRSVYEIAQDISEGLARAACCAKVNGQVTDLRTVISQDCELAICTADDPRQSWLSAPALIRVFIMTLTTHRFPGRIWTLWKRR